MIRAPSYGTSVLDSGEGKKRKFLDFNLDQICIWPKATNRKTVASDQVRSTGSETGSRFVAL